MTMALIRSNPIWQARSQGLRRPRCRRAHNPEVVGSNPTPATHESEKHSLCAVLFGFAASEMPDEWIKSEVIKMINVAPGSLEIP